MGDSHEVKAFWKKVGEEMELLEPVPATFRPKNVSIPSMRVRKIMNAESFALQLLDKEQGITQPAVEGGRTGKRAEHLKYNFSGCSEAVMLKAAELFIGELTVTAFYYMKHSGRKIVQDSDIKCAINDCDLYDFLIDIIPRSEVDQSSAYATVVQYLQHRQQQSQNPKTANHGMNSEQS